MKKLFLKVRKVTAIVMMVAFCMQNLVVYTYAANANDAMVYFDFSNISSIPTDITHGAVTSGNVKSELVLAEDAGTKVLKWTQSERKVNGKSTAYMKISFQDELSIADFPIMVEYSAKLSGLSSRPGQFSLLGTNESGTEIKSEYGVQKWYSYANFQIDRMKALENETGSLTANDDIENQIFQQYNRKTFIEYGGSYLNPDKYYVHKYIINADGTYRYLIKEDSTLTEWEEPFGNRILYLSNNSFSSAEIPAIVNGLYTVTDYFNGNANNFTSAQQTDMAKSTSDYYRYIKVEKGSFYLSKTDVDNMIILNVGNENGCVFGQHTEFSRTVYTQNNTVMIPKEIVNDALSLNQTSDVSAEWLKEAGYYIYSDNEFDLVVIGRNRLYISKAEAEVLALVNGIFVSSEDVDGAFGGFTKPLSDVNIATTKYKEVKELTGYTPNIFLFEGDYYLTDTIRIDSQMNGLKMSAYSGDVNVYGLCHVGEDKIRVADSTDCNGRLPDELIGKIVKIDLSGIPADQIVYQADYNEKIRDNLINSYKDNFENVHEMVYHSELVDGNSVQTIARWPDDKWAYMGKTEYSGSNASFITENSLKWDNSADEMKIMNFRWYEFNCLPGDITGFDAEKHTVNIYQDSMSAPFNSNSRYFFYNIPEEISKIGEYYIDYDEKAAYYYPKSVDSIAEISFTTLPEGLIRIADNTQDIEIKGINFSGTKGSAIIASNSKNIDIIGCSIENTGDSGIYLKNCTNCDLTSNIYNNIGNMSVFVSGGDWPSLTSGENTITDSRFTNGARIGLTYEPFIQANGVGVKIANNYFYNHMSNAIMFKGNDHIIENNIFDNIVNGTQDAGGIYSGRKSTWWGTVIKNNVFKNIRTYFDDERYGDAHAIYIDDILPGVTIEENLFYNCSSAINIGGGIGNKIKGNLIYDCYEGGGYAYRNTIELWSNKGGDTWKWITELREQPGYDEEKWFAKYPDFKQLVEDIENEATEDLGEMILGTAEQTAKDPLVESHKVKNAQVTNNLFVCNNVRNGLDAGVRSVFTFADNVRDLTRGQHTVWENGLYATYEITPSGECSHNYVNNDLSNISITDGKQIQINDKLFNDGYYLDDGYSNGFLNNEALGNKVANSDIQKFTPPNVCSAGPITIDVSDIDSDLGKIYVPKSVELDNKICNSFYIEDFEGYDANSDVSAVYSFNMKKSGYGSVKINDGQLNLGGWSTVSIVPQTEFNEESAVCITFTGNATIKLSDGTSSVEFSESASGETIEYHINKDKVVAYTINIDGTKEIRAEKEQSLLGVSEITLSTSLMKSANVDYIAISKLQSVCIDKPYFVSDFDDMVEGTSVQTYSKNFFTYNAYNGSGQYFEKESDSNKAIKLTQKNSDRRRAYFELFTDPIKTTGKRTVFECAIKSVGSAEGLENVMSAFGYDSNDSEYVKNTFEITQDQSSGALMHNGNEIATLDELKADYVRVKVEADGSTVRVYKKINGAYALISKQTNADIPEYIDRIQFSLYNYSASNNEMAYLIDDVAIYSDDSITVKNTDNGTVYSLDNAKGNKINITPPYIPGSDAELIIAAIYDTEGKLYDLKTKKYVPGITFELDMPNGNKKYLLKYFMWENEETIKPIIESITIE